MIESRILLHETDGLNLVAFIMEFREVCDLEKQTLEFPVTVKDGVVAGIGKSYITHPEIQFNGNGFKWYEDKFKDESI